MRRLPFGRRRKVSTKTMKTTKPRGRTGAHPLYEMEVRRRRKERRRGCCETR
jgi:hypothetical protein